MFLGGSEILNFLQCSWGDQKFPNFASVLGGIRDSEVFPVFWVGSEILKFCLWYWGGIRNCEVLPVLLGGSEILKFCVCSWGDQKF